MFSFNKNKIYIGKNGGYIHCTSDYGPWFCGGSGVYLDNYFKTNNSYQFELNTNKNNFDGFTENFAYALVNGSNSFSMLFTIFPSLSTIFTPDSALSL